MNDLSVLHSPTLPAGRRSERAHQRRKRQKRRRSRVVMAMLISTLIVVGVVAASVAKEPFQRLFGSPEDYPGPGAGSVSVTLPLGSTGRQIAQILASKDVVKSAAAFTEQAQSDSDYNDIKPGSYQMRLQMSAAGAWQFLRDPANRVTANIRIPEGLRVDEIVTLLATQAKIPGESGAPATLFSKAEYQAAVKDPAALGLPPEAKGSLEGWLFPATYQLTPDTTVTTLLSQMVRKTVTTLTAKAPRDQWMTLLTKASLVQAEGGGSIEDSPKIARVIDNRLAINMPLQFDTTVNYALKQKTLHVSIKNTQVNSPYNTYLHPGLPPGPICNAGEIALNGVLNPTEGTWLYFTAVDPDSGLTRYATTAKEKEEIDKQWRAWQKANPPNPSASASSAK